MGTMTPKLTIGIPHLDRTESLTRAIDSCLRQTIPVQIIVADQGQTEATAQALARYTDHPHVLHRWSNAKCLWENWDFVARQCDTEYFAWLQDDDVVGRGYARRIITALDRYKDANHWQARCQGGINEHMGAWFSGNGPWVPMHLLDGHPACWDGEILVPTMYLTSWSLSPAVAFRAGPDFTWALDQMPTDADLFAERLILAYMGSRGKFVADPVIAGYWIHHGGNESYKQHKDQTRQTSVLIERLDTLMETFSANRDWRDLFEQWCMTMPVANVAGWRNALMMLPTKYKTELAEIMKRSLQGRAEFMTAPAGPDIYDQVAATVWPKAPGTSPTVEHPVAA